MISLKLRLIIMSLFTCLLGACGPGFHARSFDLKSKDLTGAENKEGLPYTAAADSAELEQLKQAIDPSVKANLDFASSIASVSLSRFDLAGNAVSAAPAKLEIRIHFHSPDKAVTYAATLTSAHEAKAVDSKDDAGATRLDVRCLEADCGAVEVRMTSGATQTAFVYRSRSVTIEALGPFASSGSTTRLARIGTLASGATNAFIVTTEVAWGPAFFDLRAGDVEASGDLVATGGDEQNISVQVKSEAPVEGRLLGNNNHGDLLLRLSDQNAWSFLRVRLPTPVGAAAGSAGVTTPSATGEPTAPTDSTPVGDKYVPFDINNPITAAFEKDRANSVVQDEIKSISTGSRSNDMRQFLNHAHSNLPVMEHDLAAQNIPPELIFITFVESRYFYSNFDISVSSAGAVGPWQFMIDTAKALGLKAFEPTMVPTRILKGKQMYKYIVNPCDERGDLHLSTQAAAKYLRDLFATFRNDPKLAVMAYNMGAGGLNRRLNCINQKKNGVSTCTRSAKPLIAEDLAGLDYWTIRDLNAAPKESIDYVPRFLAAQFVGREPSRYGLKVDANGFTAAPAILSSCK